MFCNTVIGNWQEPYGCRHVIALLYHYALAIVVEAIVGKTTMTLRWRSRCQAGDDGDHDDALEMEIKSTR